MNPKLLFCLAWVFYVAERQTADPVWLFCMGYSTVLAICAYFYQKENRTEPPAKKDKKDRA